MNLKNRHPITKNLSSERLATMQRQELKYSISNNMVDLIIPELLNHLELDGYSKNGFYEIYTVYFDTLDWQAFNLKMAGVQKRRKYRVRTYYANPKSSEPVFLEIKGKDDNTTIKERAPITMSELQDLMAGKAIPNQNHVHNEWRRVLARNNLKPRLLNTYRRLAFTSPRYPGLRITIDRDIRYTLCDRVQFDLPTKTVNWSYGKSVIEIKFDRYVPLFVADMIRKLNLTRQPISKYCDSVISNYLLM